MTILRWERANQPDIGCKESRFVTWGNVSAETQLTRRRQTRRLYRFSNLPKIVLIMVDNGESGSSSSRHENGANGWQSPRIGRPLTREAISIHRANDATPAIQSPYPRGRKTSFRPTFTNKAEKPAPIGRIQPAADRHYGNGQSFVRCIRCQNRPLQAARDEQAF